MTKFRLINVDLAWPSIIPIGLTSIVLGSLSVIFIGYSESLAAAKEEGSKYGYEIDASQEMVAQGMANSVQSPLQASLATAPAESQASLASILV